MVYHKDSDVWSSQTDTIQYCSWSAPEKCWPAYVIIAVADVLAPNRGQAINNQQDDLTMTNYRVTCIIMHNTDIVL